MWYEETIRARLGVAICCTVLCFSSIVAFGAEEPLPFRRADTSSPRATLKTFIDSLNELHQRIQAERYVDRDAPEYNTLARRILDCLDASELPGYSQEQLAGEVAVCIKEILDRVEPTSDTIAFPARKSRMDEAGCQ